MNTGGGPKILVLTALAASLIVSAFAFFVHNRLYSNDLRRTEAAESALVRRLAEALAPAAPSEAHGALDAAELALTRQPPVVGELAGALFDAAELEAFEARRVRGPFEAPAPATGLGPPEELTATYALGAVTLTWSPGAMNRVRAQILQREGSELRLGQRIYRGSEDGELRQVATLPLDEVVWRDTQMPLAASRLTYQVWAVLLRHEASGDVLVDAERSPAVTVATPEHFTLNLLAGDGGQAQFLIQVNLPQAVGDRQATARVGEELMAGSAGTGLILKALELVPTEALITQRRLVLTTDGSLVLDPDTHQPRTTQTQVLKPVTRLVATLATRDGAVRTLHVDLP